MPKDPPTVVADVNLAGLFKTVFWLIILVGSVLIMLGVTNVIGVPSLP